MTSHQPQAADPRQPGQRLVHVVAMARDRAIGRDGDLPWHLPEDLARFKALTSGGVMLMGRATYESIGRPLPGRVSIVLTRDDGWVPAGAVRLPEGVERASTLPDALAAAAGHPGHRGDREVLVVGGGRVYEQTLRWADVLEVTEVDAEPEGADAFHPPIVPALWRQTAREPREGMAFVRYERR